MVRLAELLQDAHKPQIAVSVLLRKALVFATSEGMQGLVQWINWELNGYGPAKDIPDYRRPQGMLITHDRFGRTIPISFRAEQADLEEEMCAPPIGLPITKLEAELRVHASERTIETTVAPVVLEILHKHWRVEVAHMSYSIADFQAIVEGVRTRLVTELAGARADEPIAVAARNPHHSKSPIAWFKALGVAWQALIGLATIVGAIAAVLTLWPRSETLRDARPAPADTVIARSGRDTLTTRPARLIRARTDSPAPATIKRRADEPDGPVKSRGVTSWSPPPYASLKLQTFRTHPVEFKLWGDSLIVDILMEPGASADRRWLLDSPTRPLLKCQVYSTRLLFHPGETDSLAPEGQWIVAEKDRAVFVVPKDRVLFKNLRITPCVLEGDSLRYPTVTGKWMRKGDAHSWYFWLKIDNSGAITKAGWKNSDSNPGAAL